MSTHNALQHAGFGADAPRTLVAYGDPDDHLRLAVLICRSAEAAGGPVARDALGVCTSPKAPWTSRLEALRQLLLDARPPCLRSMRITDVDALYVRPPGIEDQWKDDTAYVRDFARERASLRRLLLDAAAERGGLHLDRPLPCPEVDQELSERGIVPDPPGDAGGDNAALPEGLTGLPVELRPLAKWLLRKEIVGAQRLSEHVRAAGDRVAHVLVAMVYDCLPLQDQEAAKSLVDVRTPMARNGAIGPFRLAMSGGKHRVSRTAADHLQEAGFLQSFPGEEATVRVPRTGREYLRRWTELVDAEAFRARQRWLASRPADSDVALLEAHHHAILAEDTKKALETARYYGNDLRRIAVALSRRGCYAEAADLFRGIREDFDADDAYAWEYWAFNAARAKAKPGALGAHDEEILEAYKKASDLERTNPLYCGRWIGFKAELGKDITAEMKEAAARFTQDASGSVEIALGYLAMPVRAGLIRGLQKSRVSQQTIDRFNLRWSKYIAPLDHARNADDFD